TKLAGEVGTKLRDRSKCVKRRGFGIARGARSKAKQRSEKVTPAYDQLLNSERRVGWTAERVSRRIACRGERSTNPLVQLKLEGLRQTLDEMMPRVKQVMKQTRARIHRGDTRSEDKLLSVFEPSTEIIRKGKSGKPNEFGKMVKLQEAENQII